MGSKCTIINQMQDSFPNVGFECFEWDIIFDPQWIQDICSILQISRIDSWMHCKC